MMPIKHLHLEGVAQKSLISIPENLNTQAVEMYHVICNILRKKV